jgi:hypothetical protein
LPGLQVSLLDMNQAAVLWYQQHSSVPVASLAMGTCPMPHPKDRDEALDQLEVRRRPLVQLRLLAQLLRDAEPPAFQRLAAG